MNIIRTATLLPDFSKKFQTIDGFGLNINSKYWNSGELKPVVDFLIDDLGATLFRLDHYGRANWMDPDNSRDASVLSRPVYDEIYQTPDFQNALAMSLYLNTKGIEPYITVSGIAPAWMCSEDGKTLKEFDLYAEMTVDYIHWLRRNGVKFTLFGPLNETDFGPPEGPSVHPEAYRLACKAILKKLDERGMQDVRLVVAEQGAYNLDYVKVLLEDNSLRDRIGVIGMHAYSDFHVQDLLNFAEKKDPTIRCWMTEFGDLSQSIEREEQIAWVCAERLFRLLSDGMHGALLWDAFDNYHDHDETWTTFGIIKNAWDTYFPKKRYYALKHIFRFVRPGFKRIAVQSTMPEIQVLAFSDDRVGSVTVVGMNPCNEGVYMDLDLGLYGKGDSLQYLNYDVYRTNTFEDCAKVTSPVIKILDHSKKGFEFTVLPHSIFTVTNVQL